MKNLLSLAFVAALAPASHALFISEILLNPPGTDQGLEGFEIQGAAGTNLDGVFLIQIEGDANSAAVGTVDTVFDLTGSTLGANGLLLGRDANTTIPQLAAPAPETTVILRDANPDIENGDATTWLLVRGFTGARTNDLDTDNDGTLDSTPWTSVLDAVAWGTTSNSSSFRQYAGQFGGTNLGIATGINGNDFEPDWIYRILNASKTGPAFWAAADLNTSGTAWVLDDEERIGLPGFPGGQPLTGDVTRPDLGNINVSVVPEPASMTALALGVIAALRRRKK